MESPNYYDRVLAAFDADNGTLGVSSTITAAVGFIEYFYCIYHTHKDGKGPFPLWMHLFYLAHDSTWAYLLAQEAPKYGNHVYFTAKWKGLVVWSLLEVYCIYRAIVVEREGPFSDVVRNKRKFRQALCQSFLLLLGFYGLVLTLISMIGRESWMHWGLLTNMLMAVGPGGLWLQRGSRHGTSLGLAAVIVFGTIFSFVPYSQWVLSLPEVFDNRIYYSTGIFFTLCALHNFSIVASYPSKTTKTKQRRA